MKCEPLLCYCYTGLNKFLIFNPFSFELFLTNEKGLIKEIDIFKCANKQK